MNEFISPSIVVLYFIDTLKYKSNRCTLSDLTTDFSNTKSKLSIN